MIAKLFSRPRELRFLLLALALVFCAFLLSSTGLHYQQLTEARWEWVPNFTRYALAVVIYHLLLSWYTPKAEQTILPMVALLGGIGLMLIHRIPFTIVGEAFSRRVIAPMNRQTVLFIAGLALSFVALKFPGDLWVLVRRPRWRNVLLVLVLLLLFGTALWGTPANSADPNSPKVSLDFFGFFNVQPAELAKLFFALYAAGYLATDQKWFGRWRYLRGLPYPQFIAYLPILILVLGFAILGLFMMSDLGVVLILCGLFCLLIYSSLPTPITRYLLALMGAAFVVLFLISGWGLQNQLPIPPIVTARVDNWLDPWTCEGCNSYQTLSGLYAVSAGKLWGKGAGQGNPEYISVRESDLIFAVWVEEWGALGGIALIALYLLLIRRGLLIAQAQRDRHLRLAGVGITGLFILQLLIILGGTLNLIPLTGITVPFLSYGGTSLLVNGLMIGLLLRLSLEGNPQKDDFSADTRIATIWHGTLFGHLFIVVSLLYWTIWMNPKLYPTYPRDDQYSNNAVARQRREAWLKQVERGAIFSADGQPLSNNGNPSLALTVGETSQSVGVSGLERAYNDTLLGRGRWDLGMVWAQWGGGSWRGNDLILSIESTWQAHATNALGERDGAIVLLDAQTGAVLAMVSQSAETSQLNLPLQGLYPPGSTFKSVVAAAALSEGLATPDTMYDFLTDRWEQNEDGMLCHKRVVGGAVIPSCNSTLQQMTLAEGFAWSDNVLFAELAVAVGGGKLQQYSAPFGFGQTVAFDLPVAQAQLTESADLLNDSALLAVTGLGQGDVVATPLHVALIAATIANEGRQPRPYLVSEVRKPNGKPLQVTKPSDTRTFSADVAGQLRQMMIQTVEDGWGSKAAVEGVVVGGKTGTAEWSGTSPHSWFMGFAELPLPTGEQHTVAFAVLVVGGGQGSEVAVPLTGELLHNLIGR